MRTPNQYIKHLGNKIKEQRGVFILFVILRLLVALIMIRSIMLHNYDSTLTCLLVLALFFVPSLLEETLKLKIPALFEGIIYCFIFAAEILGELGHFYTHIGILDTMKDLLVNFIGAVVFCVFGFLYLRAEDKGKKAKVSATIVDGLKIQPVRESLEEDRGNQN